MSLQAWNVLLNAAILALLTVGGFVLRHIIKQQLKLKDATIEKLQAAIDLQEAEANRLKDDRAPAIAEAYRQMRAHADQMTQDADKLKARFAQLNRVILQAAKLQTFYQLSGEIDGL